MKLTLVITNGCLASARAKETLTSLAEEYKTINLVIENLHDSGRQNLFIVPALFVDGELLIYGEIDKTRLAEILNLKQ